MISGHMQFLQMDVAVAGTKHVQSKNEAFLKLEQPNTWGYLRILIGILELYSQFFPLYDLDNRHWRYIFSNQPYLGTLYQKE